MPYDMVWTKNKHVIVISAFLEICQNQGSRVQIGEAFLQTSTRQNLVIFFLGQVHTIYLWKNHQTLCQHFIPGGLPINLNLIGLIVNMLRMQTTILPVSL